MSNPTENRNDPGFNNIQSSAVEKRTRNRLLQKYTILTALAIVALIVFMLIVMAIGGIIQNLSGEAPARDNERVDWGTISVAASDTLQGPLVLVNSTHAYTFPATTDHLKEIYAVFAQHDSRIYWQSGISTYMEGTALDALDAMLTDFAAATGNTHVQIRDAYRTEAEQEGKTILPGYSDHHTGYGCSLKFLKDGQNPALEFEEELETYGWILDNCHKYGFVRRYPADKIEQTGVEDYLSYFRYVGVAHATYMKEKNLCMEEYITLLHDYTDKDPLEIKGADGKAYEVYYVAVSGSANVKYPTNYAYTISGTNEGGVVVTIDRSQAIDATESTDTSTDTAADTTPAN